ncbi:imm11 family protein [Aquimarina sp. 2201CG5-10]|uniref:imm11 family protein n=1 Tax=Aquimarina callyspongiae TaxID=3098150 RepID=UPI002AB4EBC7|nr:DUF1629 domain-containing protein [Aquimarina sp. 2201CG5-10]MDY8136051.1 hypothetical protein [Aquimarina sp. 2201CG5-10]
MSLYYHLCNSGGMTTYIEGVNRTSKSLIRGKEIIEKEDKLPYKFTYDEPGHHPLQSILGENSLKELSGLVRETGEDHLWDFFGGPNIMSKRMYTILKECGVDNIQVLPLQLINKNTGKIREDYVVFNILELVSCIKLRESDTLPLGKDFYEFAGSLIDPERTNDALIFRKEIGAGIFVHKKIADALEKNNIKGISLIPTRKWQRNP